MKNKCKIYLLLFLVLIPYFILIGDINLLSEENEENILKQKNIVGGLKTSKSWNLSPFIISVTGGGNGTWAWASSNDWCNGSGTINDPYIIENVTIDASGILGTSCITINNSEVYFVIQNCSLRNSGNDAMDAGIKLLNTSNGTIQNNNISRNLGNGIYLNGSHQNTIKKNIIEHNKIGCNLYDYCEYNTLTHNNISNNQEHGIYFHSYNDYNNISSNTVQFNGKFISSHGIFLDGYCQFNLIDKNVIKNNTFDGIRLDTYSHNNTIAENIIVNNSWAGITLTSSSECEISENQIINNFQYGILISECDRVTIIVNIIKFNGDLVDSYGIYSTNSDSLNISGNEFLNNYNGIGLRLCDSCNVSNNFLKDNALYGIFVEHLSDFNYIYDNFLQDNVRAITIYDNSNNNEIYNNKIIKSSGSSIEINNKCNLNLVYNNSLIRNGYGIDINNDCDLNNLTSNVIKESTFSGVRIVSGCNENLLYGNYFVLNILNAINDESDTRWNTTETGNYWSNYTGYDLDGDGFGDIPHPIISYGNDFLPIYSNIPNIYIDEFTDYDWKWAKQQYWCNGSGTEEDPYIIENKLIKKEWLSNCIEIRNSEVHFTIINCTLTAKTSYFSSIVLYNVKNGKISHNKITQNNIGIQLDKCDQIDISNNTIKDNNIGVNLICSDFNYVTNNTVQYNNFGLYIWQSNNNLFNNNLLLNNNQCILELDCENNVFENNICDPKPLEELCVEIVDQIFSSSAYNFTFYVYNDTNYAMEFATIQIWWNGTDVSSDIINLGSGFYFISLEPITINLGESSILLNLTISASGYSDKYFETYLAIHPCELIDLMFLEIIEQIFTEEHFNITFSIRNGTGQGIDSAVLVISWNGTDVSSDIINLSGGFYKITLTPIIVIPGDDPIILGINVSAANYSDMSYQLELSVDPDTISKETITPSPGEFPIFLIVIIGVSSGGVLVALVIIILRKRGSKEFVQS